MDTPILHTADSHAEAVQKIRGVREYGEKAKVDKLPLTPFQSCLKRARQPRHAQKALVRITNMCDHQRDSDGKLADARKAFESALFRESERRTVELVDLLNNNQAAALEAATRLI